MAIDPVKVDSNKVLTLPLSDIYADETWNARSGIGLSEGGDETENSYKGLLESIQQKGQDTPVAVRPNDGSVKGVKQPYILVAGFRRYKAIAEIAKNLENKAPTIKAIAYKMNEVQAREYNLRENTARDMLSGPDLVYGIDELLKLNPSYTDSALAMSLGLSQPYVSKLHRIIKGLPVSMRRDWRERATLKPTVDQMATIAKLEDKEEQRAAYEEATRGKPETANGGKNKWIDSHKRAAASAGAFIGKLVRMGFITVESEETLCFDGLDVLMKVKAEATDRQRQSFSECAYAAYMAEVEKDDDATTASAPPAEKKAKKKSTKNGAATVEGETPF